MKKQVEYADVWPPLIDRGDIAWEIAIVLIALLAAILAQAGALQGFVATVLVLIAMSTMYVWNHVRHART